MNGTVRSSCSMDVLSRGANCSEKKCPFPSIKACSPGDDIYLHTMKIFNCTFLHLNSVKRPGPVFSKPVTILMPPKVATLEFVKMKRTFWSFTAKNKDTLLNYFGDSTLFREKIPGSIEKYPCVPKKRRIHSGDSPYQKSPH